MSSFIFLFLIFLTVFSWEASVEFIFLVWKLSRFFNINLWFLKLIINIRLKPSKFNISLMIDESRWCIWAVVASSFLLKAHLLRALDVAETTISKHHVASWWMKSLDRFPSHFIITSKISLKTVFQMCRFLSSTS